MKDTQDDETYIKLGKRLESLALLPVGSIAPNLNTANKIWVSTAVVTRGTSHESVNVNAVFVHPNPIVIT